MVKGNQRREEIIHILQEADTPIPAKRLAESFGVSRQIIVGDIALLNAGGDRITATNRGYVYNKETAKCRRVIKVCHSDEDTEKELNAIVDFGGKIIDVFIKHKVYGEIRAELNIGSRRDVENFMKDIKTGKSAPLKNVTANYHYHTIEAESEELLNEISEELKKKGYIAPLLDYEVEF